MNGRADYCLLRVKDCSFPQGGLFHFFEVNIGNVICIVVAAIATIVAVTTIATTIAGVRACLLACNYTFHAAEQPGNAACRKKLN